MRERFLKAFLLMALAAAAAAPGAAEDIRGRWSAVVRGARRVYLRINIDHHDASGTLQYAWSSDQDITDLDGFRSGAPGASTPTRFEIRRDAGSLVLTGSFTGDAGEGDVVFEPSAGFARDMEALGYGRPTPAQSFRMAVHNVSREYVRELRGLGYRPELEDLVRLRANHVDGSFIRELRGLNYHDLSVDDLIRFRRTPPPRRLADM